MKFNFLNTFFILLIITIKYLLCQNNIMDTEIEFYRLKLIMALVYFSVTNTIKNKIITRVNNV